MYNISVYLLKTIYYKELDVNVNMFDDIFTDVSISYWIFSKISSISN